jgi:hypothetical protein
MIFTCPPLETLISASHFPIIPSVGVSRILNFGSVPVEFSPPGLRLEGEILVTPLSPEVVPWSRPRTSEYFPTPGLPLLLLMLELLILQKGKPLFPQAL